MHFDFVDGVLRVFGTKEEIDSMRSKYTIKYLKTSLYPYCVCDVQSGNELLTFKIKEQVLEYLGKLEREASDIKKELKRREQVGGTHYEKMAIQPIEFINANNLSYTQGNVIKYVCRYHDKNGIEDLEKAKHYIDMMIAELTHERLHN